MAVKRCDFRIKTINSDFHVTEVPLLPDFDSPVKKYTYVWLKKSNYTTFEAIEKIKEYFGLDFSDVATEGLKDEDGVTEQIISIKKSYPKKWWQILMQYMLATIPLLLLITLWVLALSQ